MVGSTSAARSALPRSFWRRSPVECARPASTLSAYSHSAAASRRGRFLMISDVLMPEMDGNKLAERVLKLQPEAQVLLISGYEKGPHTPKSPRVRFLRKPFFPSVLIQMLKELLPGL